MISVQDKPIRICRQVGLNVSKESQSRTSATLFKCSRCKQLKAHVSRTSTGYGRNSEDKIFCFACCGELDKEQMIKDGKIMLYYSNGKIINWPGSLSFSAHWSQDSRHNFAGTRTDFRFIGPDGAIWSGYQIGKFNQVAHCRRTKSKR